MFGKTKTLRSIVLNLIIGKNDIQMKVMNFVHQERLKLRRKKI